MTYVICQYGCLKNCLDVSNPTQTEDTEFMRCNKCEYPDDDIYDFGEHMHEFHAFKNCEGNIACHYCGDSFEIKANPNKNQKFPNLPWQLPQFQLPSFMKLVITKAKGWLKINVQF